MIGHDRTLVIAARHLGNRLTAGQVMSYQRTVTCVPQYIFRNCKHHEQVCKHRWDNTRWRCIKRSSEYRAKDRRGKKLTLIAEHGGRCVVCGYERYAGALEFHHVDPTTKRFSVGALQVSMGLGQMRQEAAKCVLLCANCHREVEGGLIDAPGFSVLASEHGL